MSIFDDELVYAAFLKRDVERRRQELDELWTAYPNRRQGLEPFTITSVGTAAPSSAPVTSLDSSAPTTTPPPLRPITTTSSDINSLISTPTVEPLEPVQAAPAGCSTEGCSHDEQAQVLVVAAPTSPPVPLQDVQPLHDDMTTITSKPSPTCIHAQVVFDDMQQKNNTSRSYYFEDSQQRYIHSCKPAYSNAVVFPCLATRMLNAQKWCEGMGAQKLVMLQTVSATLVDKGPRTYILHFETVDISPKPPWSRVCLEVDSAKGSFDPQKCFKFYLWFTCGWVTRKQTPPWPPPKYHCNTFPYETVQPCAQPWLSFNGDWDTGQQRPPWPPPKQSQLQCVGIQLRPTPWPSFDFFTSVHLEKALSSSWHSFQFVNLSLCDGILLQFATESFLLVAQLLILLQVGLVIATIKVQALGCSSHSRAGIAEFFLCQCELTVARISSQRNWLQYLQILVQLQQHLNYEPVIMWDPGEDQHFIGGCKSLDYWLHLELRQIIWYCVEKSQNLFRLPVVCMKSPTDTLLVGYCPSNVQFTISWVSLCGVEYAVPCLMFSQCKYHQIISALKYLHGNGINSEFCQLIIQSNSSALECCKSSHIADVPFEVMAIKWVSQQMQYSVAWLFLLLYSINGRRTLLLVVAWQWNLLIPLRQTSSLVCQFGDIFVMPVTFVHVLFISSQNGMVVWSFLLLLLHYSSDYNDKLAFGKVPWQILLMCCSCGVQTMPQWSDSVLPNKPVLDVQLIRHTHFAYFHHQSVTYNTTTFWRHPKEHLKLQLKRDGTVPLVLAPTVVTFHKAVHSVAILEISEQVADSSSISGSKHNNTIPVQLKCGERLHTQSHYNYEIVTAVMQLGVSGSVISKAREEVSFMVVCNCPEFNKPNTSHFCSGREMVMQTFGMHMLDHLPVVGNVMSHLVQIVSLLVINTAAEQDHLFPLICSCFHSCDNLNQARPQQSCTFIHKMPSIFSLYRVLLVNSKLQCFPRLWKPPWLPPVYKFLQRRFTELVANKKCSESVVKIFLWHSIQGMTDSVLIIELTLVHMIQVSICGANISEINPGDSNFLSGNSEWCADGIIEKGRTGCSTTFHFLLLSDYGALLTYSGWSNYTLLFSQVAAYPTEYVKLINCVSHYITARSHDEVPIQVASEKSFMLPMVTTIHLEDCTTPNSSIIKAICKTVGDSTILKLKFYHQAIEDP